MSDISGKMQRALQYPNAKRVMNEIELSARRKGKERIGTYMAEASYMCTCIIYMCILYIYAYIYIYTHTEEEAVVSLSIYMYVSIYIYI